MASNTRPQSLNRYAYTENNPVNHRDHSGHYIDTILDAGFLAYDIYRLVYDNILHDCDNLNENLFSLLMDVGGFLLPGLTGLGHADEVYDLWRYADELPGASRFADDAVRRVDDLFDGSKLLDNTDDAGRFVDDVEKNLGCPFRNSFSADTLVMTDAGAVPISQIAVGDRVLAYNEATGETGYYTVTAVIAHIDPSLLELTIDSDPSASSGTETLQTTAEHPFYVMDGATQGRWVEAGDLAVGDAIRRADGTTGIVQAVVVVERRQPMYNLTVAMAHTFFVGQQQWLVHNVKCTPSSYPRDIPGENNWSAYYDSEAQTRQLAREKLGRSPVEIEPGKWRSQDGKWQYRAKLGDVADNHIHLEELDPVNGQVKQNLHLRWPEGTER